ncbi:MAG: hypothetical protein IK014_01255 [Lachnospiraceae bacterium]|nr:hypothetical protein [Lachnospiraceae bacterium]
MAKKKEETTAKKTVAKAENKTSAKKTTTKATTKTAVKKVADKTASKKTAAKKVAEKHTAKTTSKVTPVRKAAADEEAKKTLEQAEQQMAASCQNMLSSIVSWSMDALMYSNIALLSKRMKMSMTEAAAVLDVSEAELAKLTLIYNAYTKTPAGDRAGILGKYNDRITKI